MKTFERVWFVVISAALITVASAHAETTDRPPVLRPPDTFFDIVNQRDRDAARQFYKKYIDVKGLPVVSSGEVADLALQRTYEIVSHMLAGRPDVISAMRSNGM